MVCCLSFIVQMENLTSISREMFRCGSASSLSGCVPVGFGGVDFSTRISSLRRLLPTYPCPVWNRWIIIKKSSILNQLYRMLPVAKRVLLNSAPVCVYWCALGAYSLLARVVDDAYRIVHRSRACVCACALVTQNKIEIERERPSFVIRN